MVGRGEGMGGQETQHLIDDDPHVTEYTLVATVAPLHPGVVYDTSGTI